MPTCRPCADPRREDIDRELLAGRPLRPLAGRTGHSKSALDRHKHACLAAPALPPIDQEAAIEKAGGSLAELVREARRLGKKAEKDGDLRAALLAVRELVRMTELAAKLSGALTPPAGPGSLHLHVTSDQAARIAETYLARRAGRAIEATATTVEGGQ